ncbi:MAG: hypothetical protein HOQ02_02060 [Lysobacter sp.]|nr:hypothetical protein [Lysobacter sp.]
MHSPVAHASAARFARLPDRGELVAYPGHVKRVDGAYTSFRADVSEAHALHAIADGHLRLTTPEGRLLDVRYDRKVQHPTGDWTWIGHLPGDPSAQTIITFGKEAAFGLIAQADGKPPLRLTVRDGVSWLVETDPAKVAAIINAATRPTKPDYHVVPVSALSGGRVVQSAAAPSASVAAAAAAPAAATASAASTVDLLIGYTPGMVTALGSVSAVNTRLNHLVDVANTAYVNSQVSAQVRLVHTMQVNYTDLNTNDLALQAMSGRTANGQPGTVDPSFNALRSAREQYGADLVSLVRPFKDPEQDGCGLAWLIGGAKQGIQPGAGWDQLAYSVVGDGSDQGTDGKTYYCREATLAHEMGHNEGSAHDRTTAAGTDKVLNDPDDYGAFQYSFGYKTAATAGNFYTIMAYGDSGQTPYLVFSNPRITFCGGQACGTTTYEDNARSLSQTIPVVAGFRASVVSAAPRPDVVALAKNGASGSTEVHTLSAASSYTAFSEHLATALGQTGTDYAWAFDYADYNGDGVKDLYVIARQGASGRTEVHVLDGASGYRTFLLHVATALPMTGADNGWVFRVADYNRDGIPDLYAIFKNGASGRTEVHVLDGASGFQTYLAHIATPIGLTGVDAAWDFALGDFNQDGYPDLFAIAKLGASQTTEVHVLDGASGFQNFLLHTATALQQTGASNQWNFKVGDYNQDGMVDVYCINKIGASGMTEVHILDGSAGYGRFLAHVATPLQQTGTDDGWEFVLR